MTGMIDRQAAIDALRAMQTYKLSEGDDMLLIDKAEAQTELMMLPTFDTDISEYSERLWKLAYERGHKEGVVRCKDCVFSQGFAWLACPMAEKVKLKDDDFCSRGERRKK